MYHVLYHMYLYFEIVNICFLFTRERTCTIKIFLQRALCQYTKTILSIFYFNHSGIFFWELICLPQFFIKIVHIKNISIEYFRQTCHKIEKKKYYPIIHFHKTFQTNGKTEQNSKLNLVWHFS